MLQCGGGSATHQLSTPHPHSRTAPHLHHGRELRVPQLALAGVSPREDLAVCCQRHAVRAACRYRHDALVADGLHQHQHALIVEVAVAQLRRGGAEGGKLVKAGGCRRSGRQAECATLHSC